MYSKWYEYTWVYKWTVDNFTNLQLVDLHDDILLSSFRTVSPELKSYALGVLFLLLRLIGRRSFKSTIKPCNISTWNKFLCALQRRAQSYVPMAFPPCCPAVLWRDANVTLAEIKLHHSVCADIEATWTQSGLLFGPLTRCLLPVPSLCRFHPSPSDLWHGHRLHLSVLEHRLRRERRLHAVRQRGLQASVRQHRHRAQVVSLRAVHHHVAVFEEELQEVHQERRGLPHANRTLLLQCDPGQSGQGDHAEPSQQDQVHIQPGGPGDVRQHGISFIVLVLASTSAAFCCVQLIWCWTFLSRYVCSDK